MRQIQFRGKSKDTGEWVYGGIVHQTDYCGTPVDRWFIIDGTTIGEEDIGTFGPEVYPDTVGQRVGRLYEGDIIDYMDARFLIEYDTKKHAFIGKSLERDSFIPLAPHIMELSDLIGNKWDNPKLLNEGGAR